jgi:nucleotide-binding universal stress UspA family protein
MTGKRRRALIAAHDGSPRGVEVVARGREVADAADARLVIVHVIDRQMPYTSRDPEHQHIMREELAHVFEPARAVGGSEAETRAVGARSVVEGLLGAIDDEQAGVIVVGSSHHGPLGHALYGDVARQLAKKSNCYVDVVAVGKHEPAKAA